MALTNTAKPTTSLTNASKVSFGETWATITTTWASEIRTWLDTISLIDNTAKPRTLGSYTFDEIGDDRIDEHGGAMDDSSGMINTPKPA